MEFFGHVIDGAEVKSAGGETFNSVDPYTGEPWARFRARRRGRGGARRGGGAPGIRRGAVAAHGPRASAASCCIRLADLILEHADELALADTRDMGKPITQSRGNDVPRAADNFRFFADHALLTTAETLPMDSGHHAYTRYEPAGVVVAIAPWNFPMMLETWKVAPGAGLGQHGRAQARRGLPGVGHHPRPARPGGRVCRRGCSTSSTATARTPPAQALTAHPGRRPDHLHRRVRDRPGHRRPRPRPPHPGQPGARRQGRQRRLRRRRPRQRGGLVDQGDLHQRRTGLPGRVAHLRAPLGPGGLPRAVRRRGRRDGHGRPQGPGHPGRPAVLGRPTTPRSAATSRPSARRAAPYSPAALGDGLFVEPMVVTGLREDAPHQREEIFGPRRHGHPVRHRGRGRRPRQRLAVRAQRDAVQREPLPGPPGRRPPATSAPCG